MSTKKEELLPERFTGSKGAAGVAQTLINLMPRHSIYIEAFLGKGVLFKTKKRATLSALIDIDERAITSLKKYIGKKGDETLSLNCADARDIITKNKDRWMASRSTLLYCDPPYLEETRSSKRDYYRHEFKTPIEHESLLTLLCSLKCNVMISGYDSELYNDMLRDWWRHDFSAMTRGGVRTETVWMNYARPIELHDYRYLGANFREREKIKRQQATARGRFRRMTLTQRYAMLSVLDEERERWEAEQ